jgi:hypothetical protein
LPLALPPQLTTGAWDHKDLVWQCK